MNRIELDALARGMAPAVVAIVNQAVAPLIDRIAELEQEMAAREEPAILTSVDVEAMIARAIDGLPVPKDGVDGKDGRDADPADICNLVDEALPSLVETMVASAVAALPAPKDGAPGRDGQDGAAGQDGVGLAGALIDRDGDLVLTMTDGSVRPLGLVVGRDAEPGRDGRDGQDGAPGRDGFSLDDFDSEIRDGGRFLVLSFEAGETRHTVEHQLDIVLDRGVFKDGSEYLPGDGVTWGGSWWIAQEKTGAKPGEGSTDWRLAVKKGRDGRDGAPGEKGVTGKDGPPGRDGRMFS